MNETERDRILRMVAEGTLRPHEAAHLLAALADDAPSGDKSKETGSNKKSPLMEVQMERPDGSHYTVKVPPSLVPMLWEITKATVKESARTAATETWNGLKTVVRKKTNEVGDTVRERFSGPKSRGNAIARVPLLSPAEQQQANARRQVLQMVQEGRITALDASRLIQQLDAHLAFQRSRDKELAPPL